MLLSDRDILAEVTEGRIALEPWDPAMLQPSSVDVRLDRFFRVFENHRYPHIDPAEEQPELTRLIEVGDEVFGVFEADRQPDEAIADAEAIARLLREPQMRRGRGVQGH